MSTSEPLNTSAIQNFIQQVKSAESSNAPEIRLSIAQAKNGAVGILTDNLINRTDYYAHAIILALIPFTNSKLY